MRRAVLAMVMAGLVGASCISTPATRPKSPGPSSTSVTTSPATTTRPPNALDSLAAFFAAAGDVDAKIKAAAIAVNGAIGANRNVYDPSVLAAIASAAPEPVEATIPAGLPPRTVASGHAGLQRPGIATGRVQRSDATRFG